MNLKWQTKDLIDLTYFLHRETDAREDLDYRLTSQQDREVYRQHIAPRLPSGLSPDDLRKQVLRHWLAYQQKTVAASGEAPERLLPGESFQTVFRLLVLTAIAAGILTGSGVTLSFLFYQGQAPINVSAFLGIFVFLQILLILLTIFLMMIRKATGLLYHLSITRNLLGALAARLVLAVRDSITASLPAKEKNHLAAAIGTIKGKQSHYGPAFYWLFFILIQLFSACFNIGILAALIVKVVISDLAFGWQSTIQFSAQAVHQIVSVIALPWSWFVAPNLAAPTMQQIEGSRIILKDGIHHLSASGMASWWPFLCLAVCFYGLLPRLLLLAAGVIVQKKALSKIDFHTADCDQLVRSLTTPAVSANGEMIEQTPDSEPAPGPKPGNGAVQTIPRPLSPESPVIVIVPDDIAPDCREGELHRIIAVRTGLTMARQTTLETEQPPTVESLRAVTDFLSDHPDAAVLLIQEAWLPPIREALLLLRQIRQAAGSSVILHIGLIGKPKPATIFTPPDPNDVTVWKQAAASLGDPSLIVDILGEAS